MSISNVILVYGGAFAAEEHDVCDVYLKKQQGGFAHV